MLLPCFSHLGQDKSTNALRVSSEYAAFGATVRTVQINAQGGSCDTRFRLHQQVAAILLLDWECQILFWLSLPQSMKLKICLPFVMLRKEILSKCTYIVVGNCSPLVLG